MTQIHLHKDAGVRIYDETKDETVYLDTLTQAAQDSELTLDWPDPNIVRIFPLNDGRIAIVRDTTAGVNQEAAPPAVESFYNTLATKSDQMVQQKEARLVAEPDISN